MFDDLGELIFDIIKIDPRDCIGFDYNTGRYDTRQIKMKPSIDNSAYITSTPIIFKDHSVTVQKQLSNITRVTFKNALLNVPNEEILHLCRSYGNPLDNKVHFEVLTNTRNMWTWSSTRGPA
jgi:hypothetical protein